MPDIKHNYRFEKTGELDYQPEVVSETITPNRVVKIYPYFLPNTNAEKAFITDFATSVLSLSQNNLDVKKLKKETIDGKDYYYFEAWTDFDYETNVDTSMRTSDFGVYLAEKVGAVQFKSNYCPKNISKEDLSIADFTVIPFAFTLEKPFTGNGETIGYLNQQPPVFLSTTINTLHEVQNDLSAIGEEMVIDNNGEYEYELISLHTIQASFNNATILPILKSSDWNNLTDVDGDDGFSLGLSGHPLHKIKAKGSWNQIGTDGTVLGQTGFGDIDLESKEKWMPLLMTPVDIEDKLTMYIDWFNYDTAMPYKIAEEFKDGLTLESYLTDVQDLHLMQDMILLSTISMSNFDKVPLLESGPEVNKTDPKYKFGNSGISISKLANGNIANTIDNMYRHHEYVHIDFKNDPARQQKVKLLIIALSQYIQSTNAIAAGSEFNKAYLPFYLEPLDPVDFEINESSHTITLKPNIRFQTKSIYFNTNQVNEIPWKPNEFADRLGLRNKINFSIDPVIQAGRKQQLPGLPMVIEEINKSMNPFEIQPNVDSLKYLFYLPIQNEDDWKKILLKDYTETINFKPGDRYTYKSPLGEIGKIITKEQWLAQVLKANPGTKIVNPELIPEPQVTLKQGIYYIFDDFGDGPTRHYHIVKKTQYNTFVDISWHPAELREWANGESDVDHIDHVGLHFLNENLGLNFKYTDNGKKWRWDRNPVLVNQKVGSYTTYWEQAQAFLDHGTFPNDGHTNFSPRGYDWLVTKMRVVEGNIYPLEIQTQVFPDVELEVVSGTIPKTLGFASREILYDKEQYKELMYKLNFHPMEHKTYSFDSLPSIDIIKIDELIVSSIYGDYFEFIYGQAEKQKIAIPMLSQLDETLTKTKVLFN